MMAVEGPFLTAIIARMIEPEYNLAAYGVAYAFALIVESPVIMMMSASTALVKDKISFAKLRTFAFTVGGIMTLIMLLITIPDIFYFLSISIIKLPEKVAHLAHTALQLLLPWPGSIAYRRFYQGIMIKHNATRKVAYGTLVRVAAMSGTALFIYLNFDVDGVVIGSSALSMGVLCEAIASKFMAVDLIKSLKQQEPEKDAENLSYKGIINFYYPLALTSIISLAVHPMVTFFMGQSRMALESLAVLPVIDSLVFIFRAMGISYQEVGIALIKNKQTYIAVRNFMMGLALLLVVCLSIISLSPISGLWFSDVSGLSQTLTEFSRTPLIIYSIFPALTCFIGFQRAILVSVRNTKPITFATVSEVSGILLTLFITIHFFDSIGVVAAIIAYILGRLVANFYLYPSYMRASKQIMDIK